jgi:hypothetical protein
VTALPTADGRDLRDELEMDQLRAQPWAAPYDAGYADGAYHAQHLSGGALLTADTPEGLAMRIRADISRRGARVATGDGR